MNAFNHLVLLMYLYSDLMDNAFSTLLYFLLIPACETMDREASYRIAHLPKQTHKYPYQLEDKGEAIHVK